MTYYSTLCAPSSRTRPHLHCPMLTPSSLSCTYPSYHVLRTLFRSGCHKPQGTLAHSPVHACHAVQSPPTTACRAHPLQPLSPPHRCGMHALTRTTSATCIFLPFKHACPTSTQSPPLPAVTPAHLRYSLPLMLGKNVPGPWLAVTMSCPPPSKPPSHHTRMCVLREGQCVRWCVWGRH